MAGFDEVGNLVWTGEAELASNNRHAPVDDYDKLSAVDADADRIDERVSGRAARSFATIRDAVDELNAEGLTTVRGFKNLDREVN